MSPHNRRGTAMTFAILMLAVIGGTMTALTVSFAAQARRTRMLAIGAQQRQLLMAATLAAAEELQAHGNAARNIDLATPAADFRLQLAITPASEAGITRVRVTCDGRSAHAWEILTYHQNSGVWRLTSAQLHEAS